MAQFWMGNYKERENLSLTIIVGLPPVAILSPREAWTGQEDVMVEKWDVITETAKFLQEKADKEGIATLMLFIKEDGDEDECVGLSSGKNGLLLNGLLAYLDRHPDMFLHLLVEKVARERKEMENNGS